MSTTKAKRKSSRKLNANKKQSRYNKFMAAFYREEYRRKLKEMGALIAEGSKGKGN